MAQAPTLCRQRQVTAEVLPPLDGQSTKNLVARARLLLVVDEVRADRLTRATIAPDRSAQPLLC